MDRRQYQLPRERSSAIDRYLIEDQELYEPLEPVQPAKKPNKLKQLFSRKKGPALTEDDITPDRRYDQRNLTVPRRMSVTDSASGSANGQSATGGGTMPVLIRSGTPAGRNPFPIHPVPQRQFEGGRYLPGMEEDFGRGPSPLPANPYHRAGFAQNFGSGSVDGQRSSSSTNPIDIRRRPAVSPQPSAFSQPSRPRAVYDMYSQGQGAHHPRQPSRHPMTRTIPVVHVTPSERTESVRSSLEAAPASRPEILIIQPPQVYPLSSTPPIISPRPSSSCHSTRSGLFDREGSHTPPTSVSSRGRKPRVRAASPEQNLTHFFGSEERAPPPTVVRQPSNSSSIRSVRGSEDQSKVQVRILEEPNLEPFQTSNSAPTSTPVYITPVVASDLTPSRSPLPPVPSPVPTKIRFGGGVGYETRAQMAVTTLGELKAAKIYEPAFPTHKMSDSLAWTREILAKNAALREEISQYSRHHVLSNLGA